MKKNNILLIGAGGHTEACIDVIESQKKYKIVGVIGLKKEVGKLILNKYEVIGEDKDLFKLSNKIKNAIIAIGQIKSPSLRINCFRKLKKLNFNLPIIKSPFAVISKHSQIGEGTIVMHRSIIGSNVKIGKNCIINSNSLIEHGSMIGDNTHVATSVTINSGVRIQSNNFIGSNSVIKQNLVIGRNSVIGMGSVVLRNCSPESLIKGNEKK